MKGVRFMKNSIMKVTLFVLLAAMILLAGCSGQSSPSPTPSASNQPGASASPSATPSEKPLDYPKEPIHIMVTFSPGGGNDLIARAMAEAMAKYTTQPIVVDNITGAGGLTGTAEVVNAKPDGYKILIQDASLTGMFVYQQDIPFTLEDLEPIASVYKCPTWVLSPTERGYKTLQDFVDAAKANPGQLTIGTAVTTGSQYLMAEAIIRHFGLDVKIVPYAGGGELKVALLGNQVDMGIIHAPIQLPEVKEGLLTVLVGGSSLEKVGYDAIRNVKTLRDYGMDFDFTSTRGFLVPKGTPAEIKEYLVDLIKKALDDPSIAEFSETFGYGPEFMDSETYSQFLKDEYQTFYNIKNAK